MKALASALALAALLAVGSPASAAGNPPAPFFAATANSSKMPAKPPSATNLGGGGVICRGTCTITCADDSVHEYYDVRPETCCNFNFGASACPGGAQQAIFSPTFSNDPGSCFGIFCY